jgi:hypothetical protein
MRNHRLELECVAKVAHVLTGIRWSMLRIAGLCALAALSCGLQAQTLANPPTESDLAEIATRGRSLAGYDAAAWHASDAVSALKPDARVIDRFIARKTDAGWVVAWGRFNEARTRFLITYEAQQEGSSNEYSVIKHDPVTADDDFYFHAALAHELCLKDFFRNGKPPRPYNISVLPGAGGQWYVYAIPAQTDLDVLPYGGDVRYTVSPDGATILEKRQMHKTVLEEHVGKDTQLGFHTHILSDIPEDSDVFYASTRKAARGEWIVTKNYFFAIDRSDSLKYLGPTADVVKLLRDGKMEIEEPYKSMVLSSAEELLKGVSSGNPLEAFTLFSGARCTDKTLWLKFTSTLRNVGEQKIILYKEPLRNSQGRFGRSATTILSGKYEKLAFFTVEKVDLSSDRSYISLAPGMVYNHEQEYPMLGIDMKEKAAVQFLYFSWPVGEEKQIETQRTRLESAGYVYADSIAAAPIALAIDPGLLKQCPPSK